MSDDIDLCGQETKLAMEPCIRESGHSEPHAFWYQSECVDGTYGVTVSEGQEDGSARMLYHFDCSQALKPEEVATLTALFDLRHSKGGHDDE